MESIVLNVESRDLGKKGAKAVRNAGNVPCVLYGPEMDPVHFQVAELALRPLIFTHETHTVEIHMDGESWDCILRAIDFHPVTDRPIHVDFQRLTAGQVIRVTVPVQLVGTPAGQLEGGLNKGAGYALYETNEWNSAGQVTGGGYWIDAKTAAIGESPYVKDLSVYFADTYEPTGPHGAKGIGEAATNPVAAAYANAIYNALGIRFYHLPITPEMILRALKDEEN